MIKNLQLMAGQTTIAEGLVAGISVETIRDVIASHRSEHVAATIACSGQPCVLLALLDTTLVHIVVELLAGGNGAEPMPEMPRTATAIDAQYAHTVVTLAAVAIEAEWKANGFGQTRASKLDGPLAVDVCGARIQQVAVASLTIGLFGMRGTLRLVLPPAALESFREAGELEPEPELPTADPDPVWSERFKRALGEAPVKVEAFFAVQELSLGAVANLRVGQVLDVARGPSCRASLVCDGRTLFRGELGQEDGHYALRLEEKVVQPSRKSQPETPQTIRPSYNLARTS